MLRYFLGRLVCLLHEMERVYFRPMSGVKTVLKDVVLLKA